MNIWIVGAGPMAACHAKALNAFDCSATIVATSAVRAGPLSAEYSMDYIDLGLSKALELKRKPDAAIVCLPIDQLAAAAVVLLEAGVQRILLEKPGGLSANELDVVADLALKKNADVFVAYNRRFLASTIEAKKRIEAAGGALSASIDFCENSYVIDKLPTPEKIKQKWLLANSSHVLDLAFYLCGFPSQLDTKVRGALSWHRAGAFFSGSGTTSSQTEVVYSADWRGPGRWGLEITLPQERLIFRPLEKLQVMVPGSFSTDFIDLDYETDIEYKPGIYLQLQSFLGNRECLLTAAEQAKNMRKLYNPIAGYSEDQ